MEWFVFWLIVNCIVGGMIGQRNNDVAGSIIVSIRSTFRAETSRYRAAASFN
ncbi:MAG TPA: hypothetical protein VL136_03270 [Candidatus Babeliales bacterium]|nr:hypothetical protein [Candidatus Babeliales bacterium]